MGSDYHPKYDQNYEEFKEALEREKEMKIEQHRRMMEQEVERNRIRNNIILQNAENSYKIQLINYIISNRSAAGYNINPYNMSTSELEYWRNKINEKIKSQVQDMDRKMEQIYRQLGIKYF